MNSETDFVAKNEKFQNLVSTVLETLIKSDVTTLEDALNKLDSSYKKIIHKRYFEDF